MPIEVLIDALSVVLQAKLEKLAPEFSSELGYYYPDILKVAARHKLRDVDILEELAELGALEREYHDSMILCPVCGSHNLVSKLKCPSCGSHRLRKEVTISHVKCGAVNTVERISGSTCRKCGEPLKHDNTLTIGVLYGCLTCGLRFEAPSPFYKCATCGAYFDHKDADYVSVHVYRVRPEAPALEKQLIIAEVRSLAESAGLIVSQPAKVKGQSGFEYTFSLSASDGRRTLRIDVIEPGPNAMAEALASAAKISDVSDGYHILVAPKELEGKVKTNPADIVKTYEKSSDIREKVSQVIESIFGKKPRLGGVS